MDPRAATRTRLSILPLFIALIFNIVLAAPITSSLSSLTLALAGTSFDASDGNLSVEAGETDWCSPSLAVTRTNDLPTGQTDNSYKGAKENETNPDVDFGSIPNNKVDLDRLYIASETAVSGDLFVYLGWVRNDTTGTGTISFELNQSEVVLSNGINHQRTVGDLLFEFNFQANPGSQGGYEVELTYRVWSGTAWGDAIDMGGFAEGSVNAGPIVDCENGNQALGTGAFGEFSVNLSDLLGGDCRAFASLFAKSRSSNQITSELKEVIAPTPVNFSTCGQITILKVDESQLPLGGATFSVTPNPFTLTGSLSVTDDLAPDDDATDGTIHLSDVEPGTYTVCETAAPAGYIIDTACVQMTVGFNGSATFGPFTNGLGDIAWTKIDAQTDAKLCCATFTVAGTASAASGFSATVTDNGLNDADPDNGELLLVGLKLGTYRITETVPPLGYDLPSPAFQDVVLAGQMASAASAFEDAPQADASITKEAVVDPIVAGEDAAFTITVSAGGTGASEDVVLTDLNDTGHDWTVSGADAGDCADTTVADGETLSCDFGDVPNGESRTVTITMASDADDCANGIANTASVASSNDHDSSNNEASDSITVFCPNPGVAKEAVADPIVFGDDAVFTIAVNAGGSGPATNVVLSDLNDTGHAWTISGTDAGACADTTVADGETLTCTWSSIPSGETRSVTVTMTSGAGDCELGIENTASITADADVDTSNNEASDSIVVLCPDPSVVKSADADPIGAGEDASFDIVVTAGGSGDSESVVLSDLNETDHTWTVSGADAAACADLEIAPGESLSCDFGTIAEGASRTVTITMTSDAGDCALGIENTASITADADLDESNNTSSDDVTVLCPDLELDKDGSDPVSAGDDVFFTLGVTNHGDGTAMNVVLSDQLPGTGVGTWFIDATENIDESDCSIVADLLTCSIDELAAGASFSVTVASSVDAGACPSIENDASVSATNEAAQTEWPNTDAHTIVVDCPDVTIDKEPVEGTISAGEQGQFTIRVWNEGPGVAYDVEVSDTLPANTVWELLDDDGMDCSTSLVPGQQMITCSLDELAPGEENAREILIGYETTQDDCGLLDNSAIVSADNEPAANAENNADEASIVVECPGLNIVKVADADPIDAGDEASFHVYVWNAGPGDAFDVTMHDDLPEGLVWDLDVVQGEAECMVASSAELGEESQMSIDCDLDDLAPSSMEDGVIIRVFADTDRTDCGLLHNEAWADASNGDRVDADADITVKCPTVAIDKANDAVGSVLPGTLVSYTLTVTITDGPAEDVQVVDTLPDGLEDPGNISNGGSFDATDGTITWDLGDLADGEYTLTYEARVAAGAEQGDELVNVATVTSPNSQCPDLETLGPECDDDSIVTVRVPELVIDKVADVEVITISGEDDALVATPSIVTWTLTYTLTNGPVTNAVITDEVPDGLVFLDASNGGQLVDGVVTWTFPTLTASGSVTFRTTVDPETISRSGPTVNVAVIDSDETTPDEGEDGITVVVEPPVLGGTPTPRPSLPDTAAGIGPNGEPITVPVELLVALFLGSLGAMALANVKARSRRR